MQANASNPLGKVVNKRGYLLAVFAIKTKNLPITILYFQPDLSNIFTYPLRHLFNASNRSMMLSIEKAILYLQQGGVVAIPTETVYGLAADASQPKALKRIFTIKGRPVGHPLIVHIGSVAQVQNWADDIPNMFWPLAERFWPGPLTVILKKQAHVDNLITGGQNTIALRVPAHKKVLQLLNVFGGGLAAPSANQFGHVSPTKPQHVIDELGDNIDGIVDGGTCEIGIESTILDLSTSQPKILRPGRISEKELEDFLGLSLSPVHQKPPRAPGTLKAHYAPTTPLLLLEKSALDIPLKELLAQGLKINLWSTTRPIIQHNNLFWLPSPEDSNEFAKVLYHQLRQFDNTLAEITLIQRPPESPEWRAVLDRLTRAANYFSLDMSKSSL